VDPAGSRPDLPSAVHAIPVSRTRRSAADRWSATDVLEHFTLAERGISTAVIAKRIEEARTSVIGPERDTRAVETMLDTNRLIDRRQARNAPERVQPRRKRSAGTV
jgi:hypothetical protein